MVVLAAESADFASKGPGSPIFSGVPRDSMTSTSRTIRMLCGLVSRCMFPFYVVVSSILLSLDRVGLEGLDAQDTVLDKFAIVDDVICLGGEHALDIVLDVAQDDTVSLTTAWLLCREWFDLKALQDGHWELGSRPRGVVEDGTARSSSVLE